MSKLLEKLNSLEGADKKQSPAETPQSLGSATKTTSKKTVTWLVIAIFLAGTYGLVGLYKKGFKKQIMPETAIDTVGLEMTRIHKEALQALETENFDGAISAFEKIVTAASDKAEPLVNLAFAFKKKGDLEKAESSLRKAIDKTPGSAVAHNNLGLVYLEKKDHEKARQSLSEALKQDPTYVDSVLNLAFLSEEMKEWKEAIKYYERYLRMPDDGKGYRSLIAERVRRLHSFSVTAEVKS